MKIPFVGWSQDYETIPYFISSDYELVDGGIDVAELPLNHEEISARFSPDTTAWVAKQVRKKRDRLLVETDWTQVPDSPLSAEPEWLAYRNDLRDVSLQTGFPWAVDWPTKPKG